MKTLVCSSGPIWLLLTSEHNSKCVLCKSCVAWHRYTCKNATSTQFRTAQLSHPACDPALPWGKEVEASRHTYSMSLTTFLKSFFLEIWSAPLYAFPQAVNTEYFRGNCWCSHTGLFFVVWLFFIINALLYFYWYIWTPNLKNSAVHYWK